MFGEIIEGQTPRFGSLSWDACAFGRWLMYTPNLGKPPLMGDHQLREITSADQLVQMPPAKGISAHLNVSGEPGSV